MWCVAGESDARESSTEFVEPVGDVSAGAVQDEYGRKWAAARWLSLIDADRNVEAGECCHSVWMNFFALEQLDGRVLLQAKHCYCGFSSSE